MPTPARRKDEVIQIRASAETKTILHRAAALRGQKLSEFMLESARRQAEETILDQRTFFLDDKAHARFLALLELASQAVRQGARPVEPEGAVAGDARAGAGGQVTPSTHSPRPHPPASSIPASAR